MSKIKVVAINRRSIRNTLFAVWLMLPMMAMAQQYDVPILGLELRPVIPSSLFEIHGVTMNAGLRSFTLTPEPAISGGASIRFKLSRIWNLESGIYYTRRVYGTSFRDSAHTTVTDKFNVDNYEVPILGLIYIKLSKHWYVNNAFGLSLDFFPTDVQSPDNGTYVQKEARQYWVLPALMANIGAEYRTENKGYFYLGILYHRMLLPMGKAGIFYNDNGTLGSFITDLPGHYFAIDLKYFFPTKRSSIIDNGA